MRVFNSWGRPGRSLPPCGLLSLLLLLGLATGAQAQVQCTTANSDGSYTVPSDWALRPSGLVGTTFRLLFVTSTTRNAGSTTIGDYNTFVQTRAKAGHSDITDSCGNLFKVVGSTASVNARANTDSESSDTDAAIYWLNGSKAADNYGDFYDGSWDNYAPRNESGGAITNLGSIILYTGSNNDGTANSNSLGASSAKLGDTGTSNPLSGTGSSSSIFSNNSGNFYALSPIFRVTGTITITGGSDITEGMNSVVFVVAANPAPSANLTVTVNVTDDDNANFIVSGDEGNQTVTIPTSGSIAYTIATTGDATDEPDGEITMSFVSASGYVAGSPSSASVVVKDNDPTVVTLSRTGTGGIAEGGKAEFTVTLGRALIAGEIIDVPLTVTGTGVTASDWRIGRKSGSGLNTGVTPRPNVVRFSGAGARTATLELTAAADSADESTETFIVALASNVRFDALTDTNVGGGADPNLTMYIFNVAVSNVSKPSVTITGGQLIPVKDGSPHGILEKITEGTAARFRLVRTGSTSSALAVVVRISETGNFVAADEEGVKTWTIPSGESFEDFTVPTVDDNTYEQNGFVEVTLRVTNSYKNGIPGLGSWRVLDNDAPPAVQKPTVSITPNATTVTEGTNAGFTVTRTGARTTALRVLLAVSENEASGRDFVTSGNEGNKEVTIQAGSTTAIYTVATVADSTDEPNGAVTVALRNDSAYTVGSSSSAMITVNDDDGPALPTVTITGGNAVTEGTGAEFTVTRTGATTAALTVLLAVSENTSSGRDFVASGNEGNKEVTIQAGSTTAIYTVATVADSTDEPNGAVTVALRNSSAYTSGTPSSATVVVNDNDLPTVTITAGGGVSEGQNASFTVTRTGAMTEALTVLLAVSENEASGRNFVASGNEGNNKQVTIPSNSASATYTVATVDDSTDEPNGAVTVALRNSSAYTSGSPSSATVNVSDNDSSGGGGGGGGGGSTTPTASFASDSQSVAEDVGTQNVQVNLNPAPTASFTLSYGVGGTATAGSNNDFTIAGSGSVAVPSGATSVTIPVAITDDSVAESNETVVLTLSAGGGYTVSSPLVHTLTITDNDGSGGGGGSRGLTFSPSGLTVAEGESGVYRVRLSTEPTDTVTVAITSDNGEVTFSPASLTFNASGSNLWSVAQSVTVFAGQDPDTTDDSATLRHTASGGGYDSVSGTVNVSVIDGDTPPVVNITGAGPISEGDVARFTLSATPPPGDPISVNVSISDSGNVVAAGESVSRSVTIAASGTASFTVSTQEDDVYEEDGRITATVAAGSGYRPHGSNGSAVVVVEDDDPGLDVSQPSLSVPEGRSTSYTMALATEPTGDVMVTVSVSGGEGTGLTVTPTRLVFTPRNWSEEQRVTVTAAENSATGRTITLSHRASGGGYDSVPLSDVMVRVVSAHPAAAVGGWQLRFGRTVFQQVVDALQQRWSTNPTAGHLTVAGETISSTTPPPALAENEGLLSKALGFDPLTLQQVVEDSSFNFTPEAEPQPETEAEAEGGAPQLALWGQGALSSFKGEGNGLSSLNGDVTTLLLGADWRTTRWQAGAALSHSWGSGSYAADAGADGDLSSSLTGLFPYGRYGLTPPGWPSGPSPVTAGATSPSSRMGPMGTTSPAPP